MIIQQIIDAIKQTRKQNNFLVKIYEHEDKKLILAGMISELDKSILNKKAKTSCVMNDDKNEKIKYISIILSK